MIKLAVGDMMQQKVLMLYNPTARKGKIAKFLPYIKSRLQEKYDVIDFIASKSAQDLKEQAKINAGLYDLIIIAGGDGSLHLAVNGVKESNANPTLAFLPYGTVNDVCHTLQMSKNMKKSMDIILQGNTIDYDIMKDDEKYYIYTLAGGMFVSTSFKTNRKMKNIFGKLAYYFTGLTEIFKMRTLPLKIIADGETFESKYILCMILNSSSAAGYKINKDKDINDQLIDLILIEKKKHYIHSLFILLRMFLFGIKNIRKSKLVTIRKCSEIHLENPSNEPWTKDGEQENFLQKDIKVTSPIKVIYNKNKF